MSAHPRSALRRLSAPLLVLFAGTLALVFAQTCLACSCVARSLAEAGEASQTVFVGTVTGRQSLSGSAEESNEHVAFTVEVSEVYKGEVAERTVVYTHGNEASCGVTLRVGTEYVLMIGRGATATITLCDGGTELSMLAPGDLAALGTPYAPVAGGEPVEVSAETGARNATAWFGFGGLGALALALGAVIWWPRRDG